MRWSRTRIYLRNTVKAPSDPNRKRNSQLAIILDPESIANLTSPADSKAIA